MILKRPLASILAEILTRVTFPDDGSTCWIWTGAIHANGYGAKRVHGRLYKVHRLAYEAVAGPIPAGLDLDHLCHVRACCNPNHLEPVTRAENLRRAREVAA